MIKEQQKKLLNFLWQRQALKENQKAEIESLANGAEGKDLREVIVKGGFVEAEKLAELESVFFNFPYVNLLAAPPDKAVQEKLPKALAEKHFAICFAAEEQKIKIALARPDDYDAREALDFWASSRGYIPEYYLCSMPAWRDRLRRYDAFGAEVATAVSQAEEERVEKLAEDVSTENIAAVIERAPVAQIVSMIVKHGIESRASDIHIEPFDKTSRVRFRVDGILTTMLMLPGHLHDSIISRIKVLANLKIDETRVPQDGRFKFQIGEQGYDLRVSVMPLSGREKVTLRILDVSSRALTLEQLGFSAAMREIVATALKQTYGMVLVTGPTGSGKSTTIFSILSMLNKEGVNISTLEDPIEYNIPGINQAQVRPEVHFTFASGIRALMRQDPDIIMVGEIRDNETAEMAIHASLTGHLLFSTLHTNDAIGAIPRLVDMKAEPFLLASTVNLIIAQRLTRRICQKCKEAYTLPEDLAGKLRRELQRAPQQLIPTEINWHGPLTTYRGRGCPACKNSGYAGRMVIAEALPITEKMRIIIANGFKTEEVQAELKHIGVLNLVQDGVVKALQGGTSIEEVFRVSKEIEEQE